MDDSGRVAAWLRNLGGLAVLGLVVWLVGTGPFLAGLRVVTGPAILAALGAGLVSTLCCAWRWRRVAAGLGVTLPFGVAVAAYYRSQLLNATLPTGVVGDVHRALRHGRVLGDLGLGLRAVVLERAGGLLAQVALAALALVVLPSPLPWPLPVAAAAGLLAVAVLVALVRRAAPVVLASSGIALVAHLTVFVVAARSAGVAAPLPVLAGLTLLALLAMALPLSLAGWGPREGVAAWAFAAAGLGASQGVTTAVAYGVLALVGCLPGVLLLLPSARPAVVPQGGAHE